MTFSLLPSRPRVRRFGVYSLVLPGCVPRVIFIMPLMIDGKLYHPKENVMQLVKDYPKFQVRRTFTLIKNRKSCFLYQNPPLQFEMMEAAK